MHTEILEQIATVEPQFDPAPFNRAKNNTSRLNLNEPIYPGLRNNFSQEKYIYFLEPEIKNILAVIRNISFAGDIVVLNSDVDYLEQIRTYLNQPTNLKAAFILTMNEAGRLQFWKIDPEEAGYALSSKLNSEISRWTLEAHHLTYDCGSLKGKCSTGETLQNNNKAGNFVPTTSPKSTKTNQRPRMQNTIYKNQMKSINSTTLVRLFERFKRTMLHSNPRAL